MALGRVQPKKRSEVREIKIGDLVQERWCDKDQVGLVTKERIVEYPHARVTLYVAWNAHILGSHNRWYDEEDLMKLNV